MENAVIRFRAKGQNLSLVSGYNRFAGNTIGYIRIEIEPDDEWLDFDSVDALFQNEQGRVSAVLFYDSGVYVCNAPVEMTAASSVVFLNLSGKNVVNNVLVERLTTYPVFAFAIDRSANVTSYRETEVSANMYEQYIAAVGDQVEKITDLTVSAHEADEPEVIKTATPGLPINLDFGLVRGETGEQGIPGEPGSQGEPGVPGEKGDPFTYDDFTEEQLAALVGPQGPRGLTGSAAGFGTVSATVDNNEGDPSVTVATSGPSTAKNINFEFKNLKGEKGDPGEQGDPFTYDDFTPEQLASLKGDTGATPNLSIGTVETLPPTGSSEVTITGTAENPVLNFKLVKGDTGEVSQAEFDEAVSDLKSDLNHIDDGDAVLSIVKGEHFNGSGVITSNPAMGRTGYLDCGGLLELHINSPVSATYNCFFESDLTFISRFTLAVGDNTITVPDDAVYYGISCTVADIVDMKVESKSTMAINKALNGLELLEQGLVNFDVIKGSIIYPNGTFTPVVGWSRTDYIDCSAYDEIIMSTTNASSYNGFFDSSKNFISGSSFSIVVGENHISIPDTASYVMFSNTDAAIANTKVFTANSSDIVVLKEDMKAVSPSLDLTSNFPILPSQLFFRDDAPVPIFKRSLFQNPARATNADVGLIYEDANGYKRIIDILEPTNIGGEDGEPVNSGNGRIYLSNTEDTSKLYYKDIDILLKDVSELNGKSVSIMSLGDSLTQGASWDGTPVTALSDELAKLGVTTTFIGSLGKKILKVGIGKRLVMFEGRGGWRYRTLTGRESKYSGVNVIIPSSQTQSAFVEDTDGTYDQCKQNNTFLYPATADDLANYPDFCYHFVSGSTTNNKSYTEDSSLGDYVIFDPTRYFSQRQIAIPDILTIAFGTNEWYLTGYDLQEALDACQFIIEAFRRASNTMKIVVIPHNSINMRRETAWETMASQLTAGVIKIVDELIADGDDNLYCCPLYANGSRYLSWKSITATADFGTNNDTQVGTISDDVHCLYETGFAASYIAMQQYTDGLTACVANIID